MIKKFTFAFENLDVDDIDLDLFYALNFYMPKWMVRFTCKVAVYRGLFFINENGNYAVVRED
jgi:hypothetical protein